MAPSSNQLIRKMRAFLVVSRANLLLASIGHATLGLFLGALSFQNLITVEVPLYIALHYSIAFFACNINCYFDYEVDKKYKKYMSGSIDILHKHTLRTILVIEFLIALFLIVLFLLLGHHITGIAALIGLFGAYIYSAEPIRIKKRGVGSPLPILLLYTLPLLGGWFIFQDSLSVIFIIFIIGYVLMNEGFTLVNMCEDYSEDKSEGIRTWAHTFGLKNTLKVAFLFSMSGLLCVAAIGLVLYNKFHDITKIPALVMVGISTLLIIKAGAEVRQVYLGENLEQQSKLYGVRLQKWFMMTRYPLMITTFLLLL